MKVFKYGGASKPIATWTPKGRYAHIISTYKCFMYEMGEKSLNHFLGEVRENDFNVIGVFFHKRNIRILISKEVDQTELEKEYLGGKVVSIVKLSKYIGSSIRDTLYRGPLRVLVLPDPNKVFDGISVTVSDVIPASGTVKINAHLQGVGIIKGMLITHPQRVAEMLHKSGVWATDLEDELAQIDLITWSETIKGNAPIGERIYAMGDVSLAGMRIGGKRGFAAFNQLFRADLKENFSRRLEDALVKASFRFHESIMDPEKLKTKIPAETEPGELSNVQALLSLGIPHPQLSAEMLKSLQAGKLAKARLPLGGSFAITPSLSRTWSYVSPLTYSWLYAQWVISEYREHGWLPDATFKFLSNREELVGLTREPKWFQILYLDRMKEAISDTGIDLIAEGLIPGDGFKVTGFRPPVTHTGVILAVRPREGYADNEIGIPNMDATRLDADFDGDAISIWPGVVINKVYDPVRTPKIKNATEGPKPTVAQEIIAAFKGNAAIGQYDTLLSIISEAGLIGEEYIRIATPIIIALNKAIDSLKHEGGLVILSSLEKWLVENNILPILSPEAEVLKGKVLRKNEEGKTYWGPAESFKEFYEFINNEFVELRDRKVKSWQARALDCLIGIKENPAGGITGGEKGAKCGLPSIAMSELNKLYIDYASEMRGAGNDSFKKDAATERLKSGLLALKANRVDIIEDEAARASLNKSLVNYMFNQRLVKERISSFAFMKIFFNEATQEGLAEVPHQIVWPFISLPQAVVVKYKEEYFVQYSKTLGGRTRLLDARGEKSRRHPHFESCEFIAGLEVIHDSGEFQFVTKLGRFNFKGEKVT